MKAQNLYLDLLKKVLINWMYGECENPPMDISARAIGLDWPPYAHSMAGLKRLDHIQACVETVLKEKIPGDLIECGAWRGGGPILMRATLKAHAVKNRRVYVADSFAGLPPSSGKYVADAKSRWHLREEMRVTKDQVMANFEAYGLLDSQVVFLEGWFKDTLPTLAKKKFSVVRLDGDMYESITDSLENMYPRISPRGFLIVDDYFSLETCRKAVDDYRKREGIKTRIERVDWNAGVWRKP